MDNRHFDFARKRKYVIITIYITISLVFILKNIPLYYLPLVYIILTLALIIIFYPSFLGYLGNYYYTTGKIEKSKELFQKAITKNSKNPTVYLNYGIMLVKEGNAEEAIKYLNMGKDLNPNTLTLKNILLAIGSCYWILGELDLAIETLENLKDNFSNVNSSALVTLGYVYFLKDDMENALKYTNLAIQDSPKNGSAWDNLGQINYKKNNKDDAKGDFKKAIEYNRDLADSYYYLGIIFEEENDIENAKKCFEMADSCVVTALNTVTKQQISEKYEKSLKW